jgi:uncharacterized protein DUF1302
VRKSELWSRTGAVGVAVWLISRSAAHGLYLDPERDIQLTGKISTQVSIRTTGPKAFTDPPIPAGNVVQSRHLLDLELYHRLDRWLLRCYGLTLPLSTLAYRIRVKPAYDGVTDYGPSAFDSDEHPGNPGLQQSLDILDHKKVQHNAVPWNAYADAGWGPVWVRVGRQDLSWGETDAFRLLDMIEPLDNRFGFPLIEDLDDRRIPLWMLRSTLELPFLDVGPLAHVLAEGYWVPGTIDDQVSPPATASSPFSINLPRADELGATLDFQTPRKNLGTSRGGGRLTGTLFDRITFSLAHYYTYMDNPSARLRADPPTVDSSFPCNPTGSTLQQLACVTNTVLELAIYPIQVSGMSLTSPVPFDPLSIFRMESALFYSERVEEASDLSGATIQALTQTAAQTGQPATTAFRDRNVVRWALGLDRNVWLRWLNPENTFLLSGQYFHTHILDANSDQVSPLVQPQKSAIDAPIPIVTFARRYEDEVVFTGALFTYYRHGSVQPAPIIAYDVRGVLALVPGVNVLVGTNWVLSLKYARVQGTWHGLGFFKDRDVAFARVQYNLN